MKKIYKITGMLMMCAALSAPIMTSCSDDNYDTQQYKGGVNLNVWGPRPVARGVNSVSSVQAWTASPQSPFRVPAT